MGKLALRLFLVATVFDRSVCKERSPFIGPDFNSQMGGWFPPVQLKPAGGAKRMRATVVLARLQLQGVTWRCAFLSARISITGGLTQNLPTDPVSGVFLGMRVLSHVCVGKGVRTPYRPERFSAPFWLNTFPFLAGVGW